MKYIKTFETFLTESIRAEEAYYDESAVQTVADGRRDLGYITLIGTTMNVKDFWSQVEEHGLKTLPVPSNPFKAYIYYRDNKKAEKKAKELLEIAERYGGFLAHNATEADTRRIGQLLDYKKSDIDKYIKERY